jgi:hypothetical protein
MRIEIIPNFATQKEITLLNEWAEEGVKNKWLDVGKTNKAVTSTRLTSRFYSGRYNYPRVVLDLSTRIRDFVGASKYPLIDGHGKDGVVVSYTYPGGDVYKHKDPTGYDGTYALRCNIVTQKADTGGELYVGNTLVSINVGDLHCYLASEQEHFVTTVEGNTPRILWMFGALVPADDWNSGKIKVAV